MPRNDAEGSRVRLANVALAATIFLSAWLLFQVQPMVGKRILPWFGGGTAVWTTVMLFFQSALVLGYLYAHLAARLSPLRQVCLHAALLTVAAAWTLTRGALPDTSWQPENSSRPVLGILAMLAASVGPAYLALAATAPLVQMWFARANPHRSPYRLYALSNVGSLAALLSYPFVVEPRVGVAGQGEMWSGLFIGFSVLCAGSALAALRASNEPEGPPQSAPPSSKQTRPQTASNRPRWLEQFLWLALPACASVALLAITAHLCQDVASIPMLWIAPMVIYLASFILTFDSDRWYARWFWLPLMAAAMCFAARRWQAFGELSFWWELGVDLTMLGSLCMACHGELARMRPPANRLTAYYLSISVGGALGGLLAAVVAPLVFNDHYELQLSVLSAWLLAMAALITDRRSRFYDGGRGWNFAVVVGMIVLFFYTGSLMLYRAIDQRQGAVAITRNFYGVLKVRLHAAQLDHRHHVLVNGRISHGSQYLSEQYRRFPTGYYVPEAGVGKILTLTDQPDAKRRVGVIGLGAGTLATYAAPGEVFRYYEINPASFRFAEKYFTYLADARQRGATIELVEGDARLSLEREPPQNYDILVIDAFSSDAIPTHLLTREAFELYLRHLKEPGGVLCVHVSSNYVDLARVVEAMALDFDLDAAFVDLIGDGTPTATSSDWTMLTRRKGYFEEHNVGGPLSEKTGGKPPVKWTDDHTRLLDVFLD